MGAVELAELEAGSARLHSSGNEKLRLLKPARPVRSEPWGCQLLSTRKASVRKLVGDTGGSCSLCRLAALVEPELGSNPNTRRGDVEPPLTLTFLSNGIGPTTGSMIGEQSLAQWLTTILALNPDGSNLEIVERCKAFQRIKC